MSSSSQASLQTRFDSAAKPAVCLGLAGKEDGLSRINDFGFLNPRDVAAFVEKHKGSAFDKSRISLAFDMCRAACGLPPVMKATATPTGQPAPSTPSTVPKRLRMASLARALSSLDLHHSTLCVALHTRLSHHKANSCK
ncbi:hypothetical protein FOZ63_026313 [Perkinsus olseni]|uniref:Uncharacterized protein n=1 Tax=Perkinsus olseni TaxID=32597 RepID=A0A7J6SB05_PEROL|nr:hypothetical protein FOZ63_026313 [Perkinsus olseni]KAF4730037.1 hypothetical protein FOZ62_023321 [Perkinsus olseni]